jgi:hypothetical protein
MILLSRAPHILTHKRRADTTRVGVDNPRERAYLPRTQGESHARIRVETESHDLLSKLPPARQREELYLLLRRAVIHLHKEGKPGEASERRPGASGDCPEDVLAAVQRRT